jgi:circadian clock protein KaiC
MNKKISNERIKTGIRNFDEILFGGVPKGSLTVLAGTPGAGKTILSQQIVFHNASVKSKVLIFQTLSEPTAKTLKYLKQFSFFDSKKLDDEIVHFVDLGDIMRSKGLEQGVALVMEHVKRVNPAFVIIDSFKVFEDLARSREELRKFSYEVAINLMAWETTTFLLGEFNRKDIETNPLFSIADGLVRLFVREESGEQQRFIQVAKMRGTNHSRDEHPFSISSDGLGIYAPRVTIRRDPHADQKIEGNGPARAKVGISHLDALLGEGIPHGSSLLISGVAGTGKTLLSLEFIYRGAKEFGEKGIFISFEETEERLRADAKSMGWDLEGEIDRGFIEIIFIPQTDILVEKDLLTIHERIKQLKGKRIAIDSVSLFVHKIKDEQVAREKLFQLATIVQMEQAIGFFATDIPYGSNRISRFGVEETVVDGVILLSSIESGMARDRYIEVYKLRNTAHVSGKHKMMIGRNGIEIELRHPKISVKPNRKLKVKRHFEKRV